MASVKLAGSRSAVLAIDLQPPFLAGIYEAQRVLSRSRLVLEVAGLLGIPVIGTLQNSEKMGGIHPDLEGFIPGPLKKMSFSCWQAVEVRSALETSGRAQVVIVGIETHICVGQTAQDLLDSGYEVVVCPDAVSSGSLESHKLGMERLRDGGAIPAHSEAVVYEWLGTAEHPQFRDVLEIVKSMRQP